VCVSLPAGTGLARVEAVIPWPVPARPIPADPAGLSYPCPSLAAAMCRIVRRDSRQVVGAAALLRVTASNVAHFAPNHFAVGVAFAFADQFAFKRSQARREVRTGHERKNFQVLQATEFVAGSSDPVFTLWRCKGISPDIGVLVVLSHGNRYLFI
jgi:hypothetical protein